MNDLTPAIKLLDSQTIDKIAAGEVIERPLSVVKELVENAIDAGSSAITVEIKDGGISYIRVTDNGSGIRQDQLTNAFRRHATSKLSDIKDLDNIKSLGFRGEALASIAAVSRVEVITKPHDQETGTHYILTGGEESQLGEIGASDGSTFLVRNLFFNVPVRRKFLKTPQNEGSYITDMMERLALSRPDISIKYIVNGKERFHTSGLGNLQEVIYRLFGKDIAANIVPVLSYDEELGITLSGFLGLPILNRRSRSFEFFFVNGRCVTSDVLRIGLEDGYHPYLMHHKFPFAVLTLELASGQLDVNVHPAKLEVRFREENKVINFVSTSIERILAGYEHIKSTEAVKVMKPKAKKYSVPESFVTKHINRDSLQGEHPVVAEETTYKMKDGENETQENLQKSAFTRLIPEVETGKHAPPSFMQGAIIKSDGSEKSEQQDFFSNRFLSTESKGRYRVIGALFSTYWLIEFEGQLIFLDQHAAHEKVKYEGLVKEMRNKEMVTQNLFPPLVIELSRREEDILDIYREEVEAIGFEFDEFGGTSYALRTVPVELFGASGKEMFLDFLDGLADEKSKQNEEAIIKRAAMSSCKAAVRANMEMTHQDVEFLMDDLLALDNPYFCPHGRPTMITMTKREVERKFGRTQ
ncbi:MAG: DNA mismatch repair endonuclease MutL [Lachnospiraceae bacterium]|jgi:DNA mismatch repair protein MutL|nr:DNA mismatch repair endonuclease MutL [Lachnospiraceae bacterium]